MTQDYDVIVVGAGAAGLSAAVAAADSGAQVLLVEADTQVGGSSRLSGGHFYAAGTEQQQQAGIQDSADAMYEHYLTLNQWMVEPSVVRKYCDLSAPTLSWLSELGVKFDPESVYRSGVSSVARGHPPQDAGEGVVQVLHAACDKRSIDIVLNARVTKLLTNESNKLSGIRIGNDEATCGALVMTTGGFGANPELLAKHYPTAAAQGDWSWYIGSPFAQGDGLGLGQEIGAALDGHNRGLLLVTPGFSRDLEVLLPGWLILVNQQGRRFTDETAPYTVLGGLIEKQDGPVYAVFDETARAAAKRSPASQAYWVNEVLEAKAAAGDIILADSIESLARKTGIAYDALAGTLQRYNQDCRDGHDSAFFKPAASGSREINKSPFYAVEVRPAIVCWTGAGLRIDANARVQNDGEQSIDGLYAAGETVGSLHGDRYVGGGGSFGPCIVFGKLAGENAARYALTQGRIA